MNQQPQELMNRMWDEPNTHVFYQLNPINRTITRDLKNCGNEIAVGPFLLPLPNFPMRQNARKQTRNVQVRRSSISVPKLVAALAGLGLVLGEVPGITPRAEIGAKFLGRVSCGDLVRGSGQSFAFGFVLPLASYRAC